MLAKELRTKTTEELNALLKDLRAQLKDVTLAILQKAEKNVKKPGMLRKQIARVLTVLNERKILEEAKNNE